MSGKQLDQWGGNQNYGYDYDNYSYDPPSQGNAIQPTVAYVGYAAVVNGEDNQMSSYEKCWRSHDRNMQTGTYTTTSTKQIASRGETFIERPTGRVGSKDEFKITSTYRVGDKSGYTEYQYQERFRRVDYGGSGAGGGSTSKGGHSISNNSTGKRYLK